MSHTQSSSKTAPKNISVYLRVRPPVPREKSHTFNNIVYNPRDPRSITVARKAGAGQSSKEFFFNRVFQPNSKQEEVYEAYAKNAVNAAFDGQHGVLFVYGQTGSGKTFTISNDDPKTLGVLQQAMREIWSKINTDKEHEYTCSVSYVQLYNEILTDLLDEQKGKVRIQLGSEGRGDVVLVAESNGKSIEHSVNDYESTMDMFRTGMTRKEMQSTSMNLTSSRSHTVFTFHIRRSTRVSAVVVNDGGTDDGAGVCALEGRLVLCDLAGSERVSKTHAAGKTLDEATHINGSLLVLGKVVAALTEKHSQHAPFRESKLTRILQYSLLGNGNTSLVVNISPSDDNTEESLSAIGFGQRAIQIKQDAKRHEVLDYRALYLQLMAELDNKKDSALEGVLAEEKEMYEDRISALKERVQVLTTENTALEQEVRRLKSGAPALAGDSEGQVSSEWKDLARSLEGKIEALERKLATTSDQRFKVATKLSEEQLRTFKLAKLLRQTSMSYQVERGELTRKMDELGNELAGLKGTDYLSITGALQRDTMPAEDAASPREGSPNDASSPRDKNQDGMSTEEVENLRRELRGMREERAELIVYYWKATQAIRMLAAEKDELAHKLRRSKTSS